MWQNSNCDQTQIVTIQIVRKNENVTTLELWPNSKTEIVTKLKKNNFDKSQKLKLWQNINYDQSQFMTKDTLDCSFSKNILAPRHPLRCSLGSK